MLKLKKLRDLTIPAAAPSRPQYVYAASGLVALGEEFVVVADDELSLAIFPKDHSKPGRWLRLFPGELSVDYKQRKKEKPDLESITLIPPYKFAEQGALCVVPSMSRPNRIRGALVPITEQGVGEPIPVDYSHVFAVLDKQIKELNIEGIAITDRTVKIFHRGSHGNSKSAIIDLDRALFLKDLHDTHAPSAKTVTSIKQYALGQLQGVDLAFTDATALPDGRTVFVASAENSKNAFDDGAIMGSAVGILNPDGDIKSIEPIEGSEKLEGVCVSCDKDRLSLTFVSDTDDESTPSGFFHATWTL